MAAQASRSRVDPAGYARRLARQERSVSGTSGQLSSGPTGGRAGAAPGERENAPSSAARARPVGQHRRRPSDAAGAPNPRGLPQTSAASEGQRVGEPVARAIDKQSEKGLV